MSKKRIIIISIVLFIILIIGLLIFLTRKTDIKTISLDSKYYGINEWKYEIEDTSVVKFKDKEIIGDKEDKTNGIHAIEKFYFKSRKPGKTNITISYTNIKNGSYEEVKYYKAIVDKDLKLRIIEKKNEDN